MLPISLSHLLVESKLLCVVPDLLNLINLAELHLDYSRGKEVNVVLVIYSGLGGYPSRLN